MPQGVREFVRQRARTRADVDHDAAVRADVVSVVVRGIPAIERVRCVPIRPLAGEQQESDRFVERRIEVRQLKRANCRENRLRIVIFELFFRKIARQNVRRPDDDPVPLREVPAQLPSPLIALSRDGRPGRRLFRGLWLRETFTGNPFEFSDIKLRGWPTASGLLFRTRLAPSDRQEIAPSDQKDWSDNQNECSWQHEVPFYVQAR